MLMLYTSFRTLVCVDVRFFSGGGAVRRTQTRTESVIYLLCMSCPSLRSAAQRNTSKQRAENTHDIALYGIHDNPSTMAFEAENLSSRPRCDPLYSRRLYWKYKRYWSPSRRLRTCTVDLAVEQLNSMKSINLEILSPVRILRLAMEMHISRRR